MNRKEFIRTSGRYIILVGLTVLTGGLALKNKVSANKKTCSISKGPCSECASFTSCTLPEAVKLKNDEK